MSLDMARQYLKESQNTDSIFKVNQLLRSAESECESEGSLPSYLVDITVSDIFSEMALNTTAPRQRGKLWTDAIVRLENGLKSQQHPDLVLSYIDVIVNAYNDKYTVVLEGTYRTKLAQARQYTENILKQNGDIDNTKRATLLAKLAKILRMQALTQYSYEQSVPALNHAKRTIEKGLELDVKNLDTRLEAANIYWNLAKHANTDQDYIQFLSLLEAQYTAIAAERRFDKYEVADIALARFYRLTYQPSRACDIYQRVSEYQVFEKRPIFSPT